MQNVLIVGVIDCGMQVVIYIKLSLFLYYCRMETNAKSLEGTDKDNITVVTLFEGYSFTDESGIYHATGSSTLIKSKQANVVVDTGGPWDKLKLLESLNFNGVKPEDINFVVCTHGHSDHVGNLNLFCNATHIVGFDINYKDAYLDHSFKGGKTYVIVENQVEVIPTPGHMHHDVSVIVKNAFGLGTVVIAGDLFECQDDSDTWREISEWPEEQEKNRERVKQVADYIVPGHGPMFKVKK